VIKSSRMSWVVNINIYRGWTCWLGTG